MAQRRMPNNVPSNRQQAVALTIRKKLNDTTYSVYVRGTGSQGLAKASATSTYINGVTVRGIWTPDIRRYVIDEEGGVPGSTADLHVWSPDAWPLIPGSLDDEFVGSSEINRVAVETTFETDGYAGSGLCPHYGNVNKGDISVKTYIRDLPTDLLTLYTDDAYVTDPTLTEREAAKQHLGVDCWWEEWTPGIINSDIVHYVYADSNVGGIRYFTLDLSDGSISAITTIGTVADMSWILETNHVTVTVAKSGRIYVWWLAYNDTIGTARMFWSDDVGGSGWTEVAVDLGPDSTGTRFPTGNTSPEQFYRCFLYPANTTDDDDIGAISFDPNGLHGDAYTWDMTAGSWSSPVRVNTGTTVVTGQGINYLAGRPGWSRRSQTAYSAMVTKEGNVSKQVKFSDVTFGTTPTVNVLTDWGDGNQQGAAWGGVCVDDVNQVVYVFLQKYAWGGSQRLHYRVWDIAAATWSDESAQWNTVSNWSWHAMLPIQIHEMHGGWIEPAWFNQTRDDYLYDASKNIPIGQFPDGWTKLDFNTTLLATEEEYGLSLLQVTDAVEQLAGIYKTIPSGDFTIWTKVSLLSELAANASAGIFLLENGTLSTGDMVSLSLGYNATTITLSVDVWTAYNTFSSTSKTITATLLSHAYLRIRRSGTTYYFDVSTDGVGWIEIYTGTISFVPAEFGLYINNDNTGQAIRATLPFFRYVSSDIGTHGTVNGDRVSLFRKV